jgi:hypothetical protein
MTHEQLLTELARIRGLLNKTGERMLSHTKDRDDALAATQALQAIEDKIKGGLAT